MGATTRHKKQRVGHGLQEDHVCRKDIEPAVIRQIDMEPLALAMILRVFSLVPGIRAQAGIFRLALLHDVSLVVCVTFGIKRQDGHAEQSLVIARADKFCGIR